MTLTKKKLYQLITEHLEKEHIDNIISMIETGNEGNIEQALHIFDMVGTEPPSEVALAVLEAGIRSGDINIINRALNFESFEPTLNTNAL